MLWAPRTATILARHNQLRQLILRRGVAHALAPAPAPAWSDDTPFPTSSTQPNNAAARRGGPLLYAAPGAVLPPPKPTEYWKGTSSRTASEHDELAVISACLAAGNLDRALHVVTRVRDGWIKLRPERGSPEELDYRDLASLLPAEMHVDFLRVAFDRLVSLTLPADKGDAHASKRLPGNTAALAARIWAYFDGLFAEPWKKPPVNAGTFAIMLKGLAATGTEFDGQASKLGYKTSAMATVFERMYKQDFLLLTVMNHKVIEGARLGPRREQDQHTAGRILDALHDTVNAVGGRMAPEVIAEINDVRRALQRDQEDAHQLPKSEQLAKLVESRSQDKIVYSVENLQSSLTSLADPAIMALNPLQRQRQLEDDGYRAARELFIYEQNQLSDAGKGTEVTLKRDWIQSLLVEWVRGLRDKLGPACDEAPRDVRDFLQLVSLDQMALITIVETLKAAQEEVTGEEMKVASLILRIGRAIEQEHRMHLLKTQSSPKEFARELKMAQEQMDSARPATLSEARALKRMWRKKSAEYERQNGKTWAPQWTQVIRVRVGSLLLSNLMQTATVVRSHKDDDGKVLFSETQKAFAHAYQYVRGKKLGVVKVNAEIVKGLDTDPMSITINPRFLPMLVPPRKWTSWEDGGYLTGDASMMKTKGTREQLEHLKAADQTQDAEGRSNLEDVFSALDALGSTPWRINKKVYDVVSTVWNEGLAIADIPQKDHEAAFPDPEPIKAEDLDHKARDAYRARLKMVANARKAAHSQRCNINLQLVVARAYLDETFYYPHSLDFRGRAYPTTTYLSHIGDDLSRGLLTFGTRRPLGERGLRWLKIHLANVFGNDKASFDEREEFVNGLLHEVYDSADRPLEGRRWWLQGEKPWQTLASCIDLTKAMRSPDPHAYESNLPVHQDGTCNGLQHYAALAGDLIGAKQVNLSAGDRPADVYSYVARNVMTRVAADAENGVAAAILMKDKVTRKVVKQTVMTTVYGVTFIGAKLQIEKQLKARGDIPPESLHATASYLGKHVLGSIGDAFNRASAIQSWLTQCARIISRSIHRDRLNKDHLKKMAPDQVDRALHKEQMSSVGWTTPLGLPVVQPYRKDRKRQVSTALQSVFISDPNVPSEIDARAQATAFPPNFIHSLDATHLMMTVLALADGDNPITFASVHDSYWTHAGDADTMAVAIREEFIALHSQDLLGRLRDEFLTRYQDHVVPVAKLLARSKKRDGSYTTYEAAVRETDASLSLAAVLEDLASDDGVKVKTLIPAGAAELDATVAEADEAADIDAAPAPPKARKKPTRKLKESAEKDHYHGDPLLRNIPLSALIPPVPAKGEFDLSLIRDSPYFFS